MESQKQAIIFLFERLAKIHTSLTRTIRDYLNYLDSTRCCSGHTILTYGRHLVQFAGYCKDRDIQAITGVSPKIVFKYLDILKRQGKASGSIYAAFVPVKMLVKFAIVTGKKSEYFSQLLCIAAPKLDHKLPKVLSRKQVEKLLNAPKKGWRFYHRDKAILQLLYDTGIRESELASLKCSAVDLQEGLITVTGKGSKQRSIPLTAKAILAIYEYIYSERSMHLRGRKDNGYLFLSRSNQPMYRHDIWRRVSYWAQTIGLENVGPHTLRHCFATHMLIGGADLRLIQKALGHSSIATTQIYCEVDLTQLKMAIKKYHPSCKEIA